LKSAAPKAFKVEGDKRYTLQISDADCTGCELCVQSCPVKDKTNVSRRAINMKMIEEKTVEEKGNWDFFLSLSDTPALIEPLAPTNAKNVQLLRPLFEFSGACAGCGETPYVKLMTQIFGDRALIANATGCSSIYGGNLPTTPYAVNNAGHGPAWCNSLFEDNAEFGLGIRLAVEQKKIRALHLLAQLGDKVPADLRDALVGRALAEKNEFPAKRAKVEQLKKILAAESNPLAKELLGIVDAFIEKSVWILGGDGWAYDIGYGGLDHVTASGQNVNILVLDTEVYSNTGGQASKSTARGAVAKFAAGGKLRPKKDLGRITMTYGNVYVASIALGANDTQAIRAFVEAEAYDGPSLIIAYSHCIAHGIDMAKGLSQQKAAVDSGYWPLYRYNPALKDQGKNPFILESKKPTGAIADYIYSENRYRMLKQADPAGAEQLAIALQKDIDERWLEFEKLASAPKGA
jgi:pyruvate-ferredoxin/flavodoxin oxidoreductase